MDMFTRDEAFSFVKNKLEVKNAEERMRNDRKALLDEIATSFQTHYSFQNVRLLSEPPEKRHKPSLQEIKEDILSGIGGLCYNMNVAAFYLLKALGFDVVLVHGTCTSSVLFLHNHIVVYVSNVEKEGDKFLVEVALGFPTFRAVSLNFESESSVYHDSFLEYKYIKYKGFVVRMHRQGDLVKKQEESSWEGVNFVLDGWRRFYFADSEGTTDIEKFSVPFHEVFTKPYTSTFHSSLRIIGFPSKKTVMVINAKTLIENSKGELEPKEIEGGDEGIVQTVKQLFPVLPEDMTRKAVASWRQVDRVNPDRGV